MTDIEKAKEVLFSADYSCVLCRGNSLFTSKERGIFPLINFIGDSNSYEEFSAADRIVGKASAFLYAEMGVKAVFAQVLSKNGKRILEKYVIAYSYNTLCDEIINRTGTDVCPMEKTVRDIENRDEAYDALLKKVCE